MMTDGTGPIVVGVDGSSPSLKAFRRSLELAQLFGCDVDVLTATHLTAFYQAGLAATLVSEAEIEQKISDHTWNLVSEISVEYPDVNVTRIDCRGYPPDEIVRHAHEVDARMVVVGNRGYGPIRSAILGSTSHRVAQQCSQDVLIVRD